jgi:hypothetical protein
MECLKHKIIDCLDCMNTPGAVHAATAEEYKAYIKGELVTPVKKEEQEKPKFCIDCARIATVGSREISLYRCMAPENFAGYNLVDGHKIYKIEFCTDARNNADACSYSAHWFKEKEKLPDLPASSDQTFHATDLEHIADGAKKRLEQIRNKNKKSTPGKWDSL